MINFISKKTLPPLLTLYLPVCLLTLTLLLTIYLPVCLLTLPLSINPHLPYTEMLIRFTLQLCYK